MPLENRTMPSGQEVILPKGDSPDRYKNLTPEERDQVYKSLLELSGDLGEKARTDLEAEIWEGLASPQLNYRLKKKEEELKGMPVSQAILDAMTQQFDQKGLGGRTPEQVMFYCLNYLQNAPENRQGEKAIGVSNMDKVGPDEWVEIFKVEGRWKLRVIAADGKTVRMSGFLFPPKPKKEARNEPKAKNPPEALRSLEAEIKVVLDRMIAKLEAGDTSYMEEAKALTKAFYSINEEKERNDLAQSLGLIEGINLQDQVEIKFNPISNSFHIGSINENSKGPILETVLKGLSEDRIKAMAQQKAQEIPLPPPKITVVKATNPEPIDIRIPLPNKTFLAPSMPPEMTAGMEKLGLGPDGLEKIFRAMPGATNLLEKANLPPPPEKMEEVTTEYVAAYRERAKKFRKELVKREPRLEPMNRFFDVVIPLLEKEIKGVDLTQIKSKEYLDNIIENQIGPRLVKKLEPYESTFDAKKVEDLMKTGDMEVVLAFFISGLQEIALIGMEHVNKDPENFERVARLLVDESVIE